MEHLAVELLQQIFTYACTDGGYTGCSLSMVSKYIRDVSRPVRFHSVSLTSGSAHQLSHFSSCFFAQCALSQDSEPRVRHLCLISAKREHAVPARPILKDDKEQQKFSADVSALLNAVAPDLYTLCLVHGHRPWPKELCLPAIGRASFPLLQELTIVGSGMKFASADGMLDDDCPSLQLPRLTRLHLTFTFTGLRTGLNVEGWAARVPRVTHLRISNLDYYSRSIPTYLRAIIGTGDKSAHIFPALEQLLVQPHAPPASTDRRGSTCLAYGLWLDSIRALYQTAPGPFQLLQHGDGDSRESDFETIARREWLDRVSGGPGCWDVGFA